MAEVRIADEDVDASAKVPAAAVLIAAGLGIFGLIFGLNDPLNSLALGLWVAAAVVLLFTSPRSVVLGTSVALATGITFTLVPINAPKSAIYIGTIFASIVLLIAVFRQGNHETVKRSSFALALALAYFALLVLTTVINGLGLTFDDLLVVLVIPGIMAVIAGRRMSTADFRVFARGIVALAVAQVAVAFVDLVVTPVPFYGYAIVSGARLPNTLLSESVLRAQGLAGHPIVMALILIVAIVLLWRNTIQVRPFFRVVILCVLVAGLVLSGTRSAILALVAGLLFLMIINARTVGSRIRNVMIVVVIAAFAFANGTVLRYVGAAISGLGDSGSYSHRAAAFESVPGLFEGLPLGRLLFGSGAGSESTLFAGGFLQQDGFDIIDNQFVTSIVTVGLLGSSILFVLIVRTLIVANPTVRGVLIVLVVMMNSFDVLRWAGPAMLLLLVFSIGDSQFFRSPRRSVARSRETSRAYR